MKNVRLDAALLRLSLVQVGHRRVPSPPNNTERLRAFRNATDPVIGNGWRWQHLTRRDEAAWSAFVAQTPGEPQ